jgi:hypothetical protein
MTTKRNKPERKKEKGTFMISTLRKGKGTFMKRKSEEEKRTQLVFP